MGRDTGRAVEHASAAPVDGDPVADAPGLDPPPAEDAAPRGRGAPVAAGERLAALDLLRGVALCGILLMNIVGFAWPGGAYTNPAFPYYAPESIGPVEDPQERDRARRAEEKDLDSFARERLRRERERERPPAHPRGEVRLAGVSGDADRVEFVLADLLVDNKMRTLFSLLFGAGVLLMTGGARKRGAGWLHYRRMAWLVVIGALHGYLLWDGDILLPYAAVGLWLYPLRNRSVHALVISAAVLLALPPLVGALAPQLVDWVDRRGAAVEGRVDAALARGDAAETGAQSLDQVAGIDWIDRLFLRGHRAIRGQRRGGSRPELATLAIRKELEMGYLAGVVDRFRNMIGQQAGTLAFGFLALGWPMLLGMALLKNGFLSGAWSTTAYGRWAAAWYAVGLPATWWALMTSLAGQRDLATRVRIVFPLELAGTVALTLAHAGAILWLWRRGLLGGLAARLEAAGRMALSNYLAQSLVCAVLFSGYGLGLFGSVPRVGLVAIAALIWCVELAWSPWWLARFRFGPAEWVWRSLTYWKRQPMRIAPAEAPAPA